ncbi:LolA-like protein, partial [Actinomadura sediminis]
RVPPGGGGPVPPGVVPARQRGMPKRNRMLLAAAGVAMAATAAGAVTMATAADDEPSGPVAKPSATPPPAWSLAAGRRLTDGLGLRYAGTLTVAGGPAQLRLRISPEGSASGTLTAGARTALLATVDGVTYIKAGLEFWRAYAAGIEHPEYYAGGWAKAPLAVPGVDVAKVLSPESVARMLAKASPNPRTEEVGGVPAYVVRAADAEYLVAVAAPHRLLGVRTSGRTTLALQAQPLADPVPMFKELRARVKRLGGATDPTLHFTPGKLTFKNCDQNMNGCTVQVPATLSTWEGTASPDARASLRASIDSEGRPLGTCHGSAPVRDDRTVTLSCTVAGRQWRTWMRAALDNPGSYRYQATARVVGEALAADDVRELLAELDAERRELARAAAPTPGSSASPGGTPPDAPQAVTSKTP